MRCQGFVSINISERHLNRYQQLSAKFQNLLLGNRTYYPLAKAKLATLTESIPWLTFRDDVKELGPLGEFLSQKERRGLRSREARLWKKNSSFSKDLTLDSILRFAFEEPELVVRFYDQNQRLLREKSLFEVETTEIIFSGGGRGKRKFLSSAKLGRLPVNHPANAVRGGRGGDQSVSIEVSRDELRSIAKVELDLKY